MTDRERQAAEFLRLGAPGRALSVLEAPRKPPKRMSKLRILTALCALAVFVLVCRFASGRQAIWIFGYWAALTTCILFLTRRALITGLIIVSVLLLPFQRARADNGGDASMVACGVVMLIVGGVVTISLNYLCHQAFDNQPAVDPDTPPPPPPTPPVIVPPGNTWTNHSHPPIWVPAPKANSANRVLLNLSSTGYTDPVTGDPVTTMWATKLQSTTNLSDWRDEVTITGYVSTAGCTLSLWTNGQSAGNFWCQNTGTNVMPVNLGEPADSKFFRLAMP